MGSMSLVFVLSMALMAGRRDLDMLNFQRSMISRAHWSAMVDNVLEGLSRSALLSRVSRADVFFNLRHD